MNVVLLDRIEPQRWRNGGGFTRELFAAPAGAGWRLRVSVADVTEDGPFSGFPGVQRWFAVVHGDGVLLRFADRSASLDAASRPLAFDGAAAPYCELAGGATQDLNLMHRGGSGLMQRAEPGVDWHARAPWRALFCAGPAKLQIDGLDAGALPAAGLLSSDHAAGQRWCLESAVAPAFWLAFDPRGEAA